MSVWECLRGLIFWKYAFPSPCWVNSRIRSCRKLGFISYSTHWENIRIISQTLRLSRQNVPSRTDTGNHHLQGTLGNVFRPPHTQTNTRTRSGTAAASLCWQETKQTLSIMLLVSATLKVRGQWVSDRAVDFTPTERRRRRSTKQWLALNNVKQSHSTVHDRKFAFCRKQKSVRTRRVETDERGGRGQPCWQERKFQFETWSHFVWIV